MQARISGFGPFASIIFFALAVSPVGAAQKWVNPLPGLYNVDAAVQGGDVLVAAADNGRVLVTRNLREWEEHSIGVVGDDQKVVRFRDHFISQGWNGNVAVSRTGAHWAQIGVFRRFVQHIGFAIDSTFDRLILVGYDPFVDRNIAVSTQDGINWQASDFSPPLGAHAFLRRGDEWIAVGKHPLYESNGLVFTSSDGVSWTQRGGIYPHALYGIIEAGTALLAYGGSPANMGGIVLTSRDGREWSQVQGSFARRINMAVPFGSGAILVDGGGDVLHTTDLSNWTHTPLLQDRELLAITRFQQQLVVFGDSGAIFTSTDGFTWYARHTGPTAGQLNFIQSNGVLKAYGGRTDVNQPVVLERSAADIWSTRTVSSPYPFASVAQAGEQLVALYRGPNEARLLTSRDGNTWTERYAFSGGFTLPNVLKAAWNGTVVCVITDDGRVLRSTDFETWEEMLVQQPSRLWYFRDITAIGGAFVVCGYIAGSVDGPIAALWQSGDGNAWVQDLAALGPIPNPKALGGFEALESTAFGLVLLTGNGTIMLDPGSGWEIVREAEYSRGAALGLLSSSDLGVFAASGPEVYSTRDGRSWSVVGRFPLASIADVFGDSSGLYVATTNAGLFRADFSWEHNRLVNGSLRSQSSDEPAILGFVPRGTQQQTVLIRSISASLADYGVGDTSARSVFSIHSNDSGWIAAVTPETTEAAEQQIRMIERQVGAFPLSVGAESAAAVPLASGGFTIVGAPDVWGTTHLIEVYGTGDDDAGLKNISARSRFQTSDSPAILGFVFAGTGPQPFLLRAVSRSLSQFGLKPAGNTKFSIHDSEGRLVLTGMDRELFADWTADTAASVGAFPVGNGDGDVSVRVTLPPGIYTMVATADGSGDILCEVYLVEENSGP